MRNILIASSAAPDAGSGISSYAREISEQFSSRGYEVHYYSPKPKDDKWYVENNIKYGLHSDQDSNVNEALKDLLNYIKVNNIQACINNDNPFLQTLAPLLDCVLLVVGHLGKTSVASLACFNSDYVDYIITISNDMQQTFVNKYKQDISKVPIVYNGVSDSAATTKIKGRGGKIKVFFGGGSNTRKGADLLLKSICENTDLWGRYELNWCGNVSAKFRCKLKQYKCINFHGQVKRDLAKTILEDCDVLLFPSREEGCPMMMLEAMSSKVIPIASDGVGAMGSMIVSGEEGYICSLKKWDEQVLDCLGYLSKNRDVVKDMSNNVYKKYQAMFLIEHTIDRLEYYLEHPEVNRKIQKQHSITALKWHRPLLKNSIKAPFLDRVSIKIGYLRKSGSFKPPM